MRAPPQSQPQNPNDPLLAGRKAASYRVRVEWIVPLLLLPIVCPFSAYFFPHRTFCTQPLPAPDDAALSALSAQSAQGALSTHSTSAPAADEPAFLKSDGLLRLHLLPLHKRGISARQVSSGDVDHSNQDFNNFITITEKNVTILDEYGAGCIQRMYFAFTSGADTRMMSAWFLHLFIDGQLALRIQLRKIARGQQKPFFFPLTGSGDPYNGYYSYVPVVYKKSCRIVVETTKYNYLEQKEPRHLYRMGLYYTFTLHRYNFDAAEIPLPIFAGRAEDVSLLLRTASNHLVERFDDCPSPIANLTSHRIIDEHDTPQLKRGVNDIISNDGAGAILAMYIKLNNAEPHHYSSTELEIIFDEMDDIKIRSPFDIFFGTENGDYEVNSLSVGFRFKCGGYILFPMPFWKGFKIRLIVPNSAKEDALPSYSVKVHVTESVYPKQTTGYFSAQVNRAKPLKEWVFYPVLQTKGRWGHFVGNFLYMTRTPDQVRGGGQPYEGNDSTFIDGAYSPQLPGTGTEDFYNIAHFFLDLSNISFPFHGIPKLVFYHDKHYYANCYRMMLLDYIPFHDEIRYLLEHGPGMFSSPMANYTSVAFFYSGLKPTILKTDEINLADDAALVSHSYKYTEDKEAARIVSKNTKYEPPHNSNQDITFRQYKGGVISFVAAVTPSNVGVLLRRQLDLSFQNQKASVYVDGTHIGIWRTARQASKFPLADDEIWIPHKYTTQKTSLHIEIRPEFDEPGTQEGQSNLWTEAHYWIFCELSL